MEEGIRDTAPQLPYATDDCPVTYCLERIGGKWKPLILFLITNQVNRFGALRRAIPRISKQVLTTQLRELEQHDLINRVVVSEVPLVVQYALTSRGEGVMPVISAMRSWGQGQLSVEAG